MTSRQALLPVLAYKVLGVLATEQGDVLAAHAHLTGEDVDDPGGVLVGHFLDLDGPFHRGARADAFPELRDRDFKLVARDGAIALGAHGLRLGVRDLGAQRAEVVKRLLEPLIWCSSPRHRADPRP